MIIKAALIKHVLQVQQAVAYGTWHYVGPLYY